MRTAMLYGCKTAKEARKLAPWAGIVRKVNGGYMVWESAADYQTWLAQK